MNAQLVSNKKTIQSKNFKELQEEYLLCQGALFELDLGKSRNLDSSYPSKRKLLKKNIARLKNAMAVFARAEQIQYILDMLRGMKSDSIDASGASNNAKE
jgi:hypothetical protein